MKTRDEVEKLKADWLRDPSFDLPCEEFAEYEAELVEFERQHKECWQAKREADAALIKRAGMQPAMPTNGNGLLGLTRLEWMAATIAAGLVSQASHYATDAGPNRLANDAVIVAKALILRLAKE